jgi:hypothetical protein
MAYEAWLVSASPPNSLSKSPKLKMRTASFRRPRGNEPTNAVIDVATPVMVRTPLGISST